MVAKGKVPDNFALAEARHFDKLSENIQALNRTLSQTLSLHRDQLKATKEVADLLSEIVEMTKKDNKTAHQSGERKKKLNEL